MKDPKEKDDQQQQDQNNGTQREPARDSNWDPHQRIDEEGNELDPDDIK
jgi:hypothetical protein